jgi:hypothetical protein
VRWQTCLQFGQVHSIIILAQVLPFDVIIITITILAQVPTLGLVAKPCHARNAHPVFATVPGPSIIASMARHAPRAVVTCRVARTIGRMGEPSLAASAALSRSGPSGQVGTAVHSVA